MKTSKFLMVCLMSLMAGTCFAQTCGDALARVNSYRAAHKARLLKWDADMEALAKGKASDLASKGCGMSTPDQGQILFGCPRGGACSCVQAADTWYQGGAAKYKFLPKPWTVNEPQFMQVGTFMQVVWASASKLGCASASGPNGCGVVVCQFDEGVISMNEFVAENVLPRAPVTPSGPSTPSTPKTPSTPNTPSTPKTPSGPATPKTPSGPATPKTPSGPAPAGCATSLTQINSFRNTHNAQGLVWDSKLTKSAQSAASKMADNNCALEAQAGQLVYNSAGPAPQGSQCQAAVKNWYAGNTQYVFSAKPWTTNEPRFNKVGGFMNMVWASAKKVGCAESRNVKAKCSVVVCQFDAVVITDDSMVAKNVLQRADTTTVTVIDPPAVKPVDKHANCPAWATAGLCNFSIAVNGEAIPNLCPVSCRGGAVARRMAAEDQDQSVLTLGNSDATASA